MSRRLAFWVGCAIMRVGAIKINAAEPVKGDKKAVKIRRIAEPLLLCLIGMGFFPILNFNPENPVELGIPFRLVMLVFAGAACVEVGKNMQGFFPQWKRHHAAWFGLGIACAGLVLRFLLEFGEASNTYNFTVGNVLFHLLFMTALTAGAAMAEKKK